MSADTDLTEINVAIVGLGLMGGSLAMALRGHCKGLFGCDLDLQALELARGKKLVDSADSDIKAILPHADLIVLATPVGTILELLAAIPEIIQGPAVILDLGSTKVEIMKAMEDLPHALHPVGGHPMCGKETSGLEHAEGDLFQGAPFALCASTKTTPRARALVEELVQAIGAEPLWMESDTHDEWVASTSHLPYLLSIALVNSTPLEVSLLIGPGFQSSTRMAASNPEMMSDILLTNQEQVLTAIKRFQSKLENLEALINTGSNDQMRTDLGVALMRQQKLILDREGG
jgi:prephenate dehydrogenase